MYNGGWCGSGSLLTSVNPADGKPIARIRQATEEEYEACLVAMEKAKKTWQEVIYLAAVFNHCLVTSLLPFADACAVAWRDCAPDW